MFRTNHALSDPILRTAHNLGYDIKFYTPNHAPWDSFITLLVHNLIFLGSLATYLYFASRLRAGILRQACGVLGFAIMLGEPGWYGQSGLHIIDYGMPAFAFLCTLNIVDVFFLRPVSEVHTWGFARTTCQMFSFVNEKATSLTPRWENFKTLGLCLSKYVYVNFLLYFVPSPDVWAAVKPYSFAYFGYSWICALVILGTLGFFVETVIRLIGIVFGVEMSPLFNNPTGASNIREFWARWNMAIKSGLSRVFFHFKSPFKSRKSKAPTKKSNGMPPQLDSKHLRMLRSRVKNADYLSETDMSEGDSRPPSPERPAPKDITPRKKSAFLPKAMAAVVTFLASGVFHEYMNHLGFRGASGETVGFFLTHALATITYSYLKRTSPGLAKACPYWLGVLITNTFAAMTSPLFCAPFLRAGFFEDAKAFGIFGNIKGFVWLFGDGYGKHGLKH